MEETIAWTYVLCCGIFKFSHVETLEKKAMQAYFICWKCRNCSLFSNFTLFSWTCILPPCIWSRNHSLYLNRHYGDSQDHSFGIHYHFIDATETLPAIKNEYIEIVGKGDLGLRFFSQFTFRLKWMTCISFSDKLDDIL